MENTVTVYGAVPNAIELIESMGLAIAKSKLLGCENPDQGRVMAMACIAKGCDPLSLAQRYDIIQGKLSKKADAMLAEFRSILGGTHRIVERSSDAAEIELTLGKTTERFRFTWEEAQEEPFTKKKNGEIKENYATPRSRKSMLWARVVSDAVRAMAPEVNCGIYTPEELQDHGGDDPSPGSADSSAGTAADASAEDASFEVVGESKAEADVVEEPVDSPCSTAQVDKVKSLLKQISQDQGQADIGQRVKKKLVSQGLDKIADLTTPECNNLIKALSTKNLELFFDAALTGAKPGE